MIVVRDREWKRQPAQNIEHERMNATTSQNIATSATLVQKTSLIDNHLKLISPSDAS